MDYNRVYSEWDTLPHCRLATTGETLWGRVLPDGTFGVDNLPLNEKYRWQDIVTSKNMDLGEIIHRRWKHMFWISFTPNPDDSIGERENVCNILEGVGEFSFWSDGNISLMFDCDAVPDIDPVIRLLSDVIKSEIDVHYWP